MSDIATEFSKKKQKNKKENNISSKALIKIIKKNFAEFKKTNPALTAEQWRYFNHLEMDIDFMYHSYYPQPNFKSHINEEY